MTQRTTRPETTEPEARARVLESAGKVADLLKQIQATLDKLHEAASREDKT